MDVNRHVGARNKGNPAEPIGAMLVRLRSGPKGVREDALRPDLRLPDHCTWERSPRSVHHCEGRRDGAIQRIDEGECLGTRERSRERIRLLPRIHPGFGWIVIESMRSLELPQRTSCQLAPSGEVSAPGSSSTPVCASTSRPRITGATIGPADFASVSASFRWCCARSDESSRGAGRALSDPRRAPPSVAIGSTRAAGSGGGVGDLDPDDNHPAPKRRTAGAHRRRST